MRFAIAVMLATTWICCGKNDARAQVITQTQPDNPGSLITTNLNIITQWNFNTSNPSMSPTTGTGTISSTGGSSLSLNGNLTPGPNNTSSPSSGRTSLLATNLSSSGSGVQFFASTLGSTQVIIVQFDIQATGLAAPSTLAFEYTTNSGASYLPVTNGPSNEITFSNTNYYHVFVNLTGLGVGNQPGFGLELVTVGSTNIAGGAVTPNPAVGFNIDSMTIQTTPEPTTLVLAGLVAGSGLGGYGWRRFRDRKVAFGTSSMG